MAISRSLFALIAICLAFAAIWPVALAEEDAAVAAAVSPAAELQLLRDKLGALEESIATTSSELKSKDESIANLEDVIKDKSAKITSLQSEIAFLKENPSLDTVGQAHELATELEKEIVNLRKDIEAQSSKSEDLDALASDADKRVQELTSKLDALQKTSDQQKRRIQKTERALKSAEEELMKAQLEARSRSNQLNEVQGAWLPPWVQERSAVYLDVVSKHWNVHAKPTIDILLEKASVISSEAKKWAEPHLETAKTKWIPVVKEQWAVLTTNAQPYVELVYSKSLEIYEVSRDAMSPHVVKVQEFIDPYYQEAKRLSKPHIDQVTEITKPHIERVKVVVKPYTERIVRAYGSFLEMSTECHRQAQSAISDYLQRHDITRHLATKELVWFLASLILALPIYITYKFLIGTFCSKKPKKSTKHGHHHGHRRHKRRHAEK